MSVKHETKGICMFAYNNQELDYTRFAAIASKYAKHHMNNIPVSYTHLRAHETPEHREFPV